MIFFILCGILAATSFFFLLLKFDIRKMLYFDIGLDIFFSGLMMFIFFGTFSGMMAAAVGGAAFSVALYIMKKLVGYKKPTISIRGIHWTETTS